MAAGTDARIGRLLGGRYRVERLLAKGGMGAVYEAENVTIGRRVAVKVLHAQYAEDDDIVARFRREAMAATSIGHEHIIEVLDLGTDDDNSLFMVLELLTGSDLAGELRTNGPMSVARTIRIAAQICDALGAAHGKGIVHRDLKPENVFLVTRGENADFVKVLDFGISKVKDAAQDGKNATRTGTALGTPYYMAPEQARGAKDVDARADLYALGVILFRALSGQHPFDDESLPMLVLKICTEPPPHVRRFRADVPEALDATITKLLSKKPSDRFETAALAKEALLAFAEHDAAPLLTNAPGTAETSPRVLTPESFAATMPATRVPAADDEPAPPPPPHAKWIPWAVGVTALVAVGVVIAAVVGGGSTTPTTHTDPPAHLPTPTPAHIDPLAGPDRGHGEGWRWLNPLPRALPTYLSVDVGGPGLVAMVGRNGAAARFRPAGIVSWPTGTRDALDAITWTGANEAIAVGENGTIVTLGEHGPRTLVSSTQNELHAIVSLSPTEAVVAGAGGVLLRVVNGSASVMESGVREDLLAVARRGSDVFVAGDHGTILHVDPHGTVLSEATRVEEALRAIGGCDDGDLYAAGDRGRVLRRVADGRWHVLPDTGTESWTALGCDGDRIAIAGAHGGVLLVQGSSSVRLPGESDRPWYGLSGGDGERTWLVGGGGRLGAVDPARIRLLTAGPTAALRSVAALAGAMVAVGEYGHIVREHEDGFAEAASPTAAGLASVLALGPDTLLAVGDDGALVRITADGAELLSSPTHSPLRDLVGDTAKILAVGTDGTLVRGPPDTATATHVDDAGDLWALAGTPDDAIAVGTEGVVLHIHDATTERVPCEAAHGRTLRAAMRDAHGDTFVVGDGGLALHVDAHGCTVEHDGGPTLYAVIAGVRGTPFAVGDEGATLERDAHGHWSAGTIEVAGQSLRGLARIDGHLVIVGTGGVIVRHILLDGT